MMAVIPFPESMKPFINDVDRTSPQFTSFKDDFEKANEGKILGEAADFNFQTFGAVILKLVIICTISTLICLFLTSSLFIKSKPNESRQSPFIEIGNKVDDQTCNAVHYELEQRLDRIKQRASRSQHDFQTIAADYVTISYSQLNVLELMGIHDDYGLNSFVESLWRFHHSSWWNALMSLIILIAILLAFVESSLRAPVDDSCTDYFGCNLRFKKPNDLNKAEALSLFEIRMFFTILSFFLVIDLLVRCFVFSMYYTTTNVFTPWFHGWNLLLHSLMVLFVVVDDVLIEWIFNKSLEFLIPIRPMLLIVRSDYFTREMADIFSALFKAKHALFLFFNILLLSSVFSMILFGSTWEFEYSGDEGASALDTGDKSGDERRRLPATGEDIEQLAVNQIDNVFTEHKMNAFSDIIRSTITMFIMILSGENMVDLVFSSWANPILGKDFVLYYWWIIVVFGLFILTPLIVSSFVAAFEKNREEHATMQRGEMRTGLIAAMIMLDSQDGTHVTTLDEFVTLMDQVADISNPEVQALFRKLDSSDGAIQSTITIAEFVKGLDSVFKNDSFAMAPKNERKEWRITTVAGTVLSGCCNILVIGQFIAIAFLSRGIYGENYGGDKVMKNQAKAIIIDTFLFLALILHFLFVIGKIFTSSLIGYFHPFLYRKQGHLTGGSNVCDFVLTVFCVCTHITLIASYLFLGTGNNKYWYIPWHAFPAEDAIFMNSNVIDSNRIWMCLSVGRILFNNDVTRKSMASILFAMRGMMTLMIIGFCFLLFRCSRSDPVPWPF